MVIDYVNAMISANMFYRMKRAGQKFNRVGAVRELTAFGLFTAPEVAVIVGCSVEFVEDKTNTPLPESYRHWNLSALDGLYSIAWNFKNGRDNTLLVKNIISAGNSIRAISELTGVPKDILRGIAYGRNDMGVLRADADTPSG